MRVPPPVAASVCTSSENSSNRHSSRRWHSQCDAFHDRPGQMPRTGVAGQADEGAPGPRIENRRVGLAKVRQEMNAAAACGNSLGSSKQPVKRFIRIGRRVEHGRENLPYPVDAAARVVQPGHRVVSAGRRVDSLRDALRRHVGERLRFVQRHENGFRRSHGIQHVALVDEAKRECSANVVMSATANGQALGQSGCRTCVCSQAPKARSARNAFSQQVLPDPDPGQDWRGPLAAADVENHHSGGQRVVGGGGGTELECVEIRQVEPPPHPPPGFRLVLPKPQRTQDARRNGATRF